MTKKNAKATSTTDVPPEIVVQTKRGGCKPENRIPVGDITVPDLYNGYEALHGIAQQLRRDNVSGNLILDERSRTLDRIAESTLAGWHIANDMRHCLQQTIAPAVRETLKLLYELREKAELQAVEGGEKKNTAVKLADLDALILSLERATKDGQHG